MSASLQLKRVSSEQMAVRNLLYKGCLFISTKWMGAQWQWLLRPSHFPIARHILIRADWGGATAIVLADLQWLEEVTQLLLQEADVAALPADLQIALAETAFAEMAERIEATSKRHLRITSMQIAGEQCDMTELQTLDPIAWQASCAGRQFEGELWLDALGMRQASAAARSLTRIRPEERHWCRLIPVSLRFVIGMTVLPSAVFAALKLRDVVVLDESWLQAQEILTVAVAGNAAFRARLSGLKLVVTEGLTGTMDESFEENEFAPDEIISDLPIKLTFDLGERSIPLGELQAIAPGYTFDLGRDMRQAVIIRANGMRIGEGELVDIEGRTGVAVLSLSGQSV